MGLKPHAHPKGNDKVCAAVCKAPRESGKTTVPPRESRADGDSLWEGDELCGAGGEVAVDFLAGHGGVVAGKDEVDGAGAEGEVGVAGLGLVARCRVESHYAIQCDADAVGVVEAVELDLSSAQDAHSAQGDVLIHGKLGDSFAGKRIGAVKEDWVLRIADADVVVDHVFDEAAAGGVRLDAEAVVGAIE